MSVEAVTDRLIEFQEGRGQDGLSPLKMEKVLFYVYGAHLVQMDTPLFDEPFSAWKWGPVLPTVYRRLKAYTDRPVPLGEMRTQPEHVLSVSVLNLVERVYERLFLVPDTPDPVELSHKPGSAWEQVFYGRKASEGVDPLGNPIIPDELIKEEVRALGLIPTSGPDTARHHAPEPIPAATA